MDTKKVLLELIITLSEESRQDCLQHIEVAISHLKIAQRKALQINEQDCDTRIDKQIAEALQRLNFISETTTHHNN